MTQSQPFHIEGTTLVKYRGKASQAQIPAQITRIGEYAFIGCSQLRQVQIPASVKEIGAGAFQACRNLEQIRLPAGLEKLGNAAFRGCVSLKQLQLPLSITVIPMHMCLGCHALETVDLPECLERIEWKAFFECKALERLALPQSLQWIGEEAFAQCDSLTQVSIPDGVQRIDNRAFAGCEHLKQLTLPKQLTAVQRGAFAGTGITRIEIPEQVKQLDFTAFEQCFDLGLIVIHSESPSLTNTGNGDPATGFTDAPLHFVKPQHLTPQLRRNMIRGYARVRLHEGAKRQPRYETFIEQEIGNVCQWALSDGILMDYLTQNRLIPVALAEELIHRMTKQGGHEQAAVLVNYLGQLRSAGITFDPTKAFDLGT